MMGASKVFGLLADDRRRRLLLLLYEGEPVEIPDAVTVRGAPSASGRRGGPGRERSRSKTQTEIRLRHVDLPKLTAADLVEWDREADLVRRGPRFDEVAPLLGVLVENAPRIPQDVL